jgi:MFS family permease
MSSIQQPSPEARTRRAFRTTFAALTVRNYRWFWLGSLASYFAGNMQTPTQSWLAYQLTNSALMLGIVSAAQGVPQFLTNFVSGAIIDRMQKRDVIVLCQTAQILNTLTIAILIATGHIQYWNLIVSSFVAGIISGFNMPARNTIAPELVDNDRVYNALALNNAGSNVSRIAGPALAGVLIGFAGTQTAYYVGVGFNVVAVATMLFLPRTSKPVATARSMLGSVRDGFSYLQKQTLILVVLCMEAALTAFGMWYGGLIPVFAKLLKTSSVGYGFMMSATGVGALIGSLSVASLGSFKRKGLLMVIAGTAFGLALVLFGQANEVTSLLHLRSGVYYVAAFLLVIAAMCSTAYTTTSLTAVQMLSSPEYRGRVVSVYQMMPALYQICVFISAAAAQTVGAPLTVTIGGICLVAFMASMGLFNSRLRHME